MLTHAETAPGAVTQACSRSDARTNLLIGSLPVADWQRWEALLEWVAMPADLVMYEPGRALSHVWFPTTAIVSLQYVMTDGASAGIAVVGNEGVVGVPLLMGGDSMPSRAIVQCGGEGYRLAARTVKEELERPGAVMQLMLRYTQALITQMAQTSACNRHHALEQQLCRWLLLTLDRQEGNQLPLTQESIARMLGVRREGVNEAALRLRRLNMIRYARGHITVLDRQGLESRSCECYAVVKREYDRLLRQ